jgi:hypothetical protein
MAEDVRRPRREILGHLPILPPGPGGSRWPRPGPGRRSLE